MGQFGRSMFKKIRSRWREARGDVLRKEVEDSICRLRAAAADVNARCAETFAIAYQQIIKEYGPLSNVSNDAKRAISKVLLQTAKTSFDLNMGRGYGLALLSAHLEAQTLPGEDAKFVLHVTQNMLDAALKGLDSASQTTDEETRPYGNRSDRNADATAQQLIEAGRLLGAKTPREAAEMAVGRELTDEEWERHKEGWQRNW